MKKYNPAIHFAIGIIILYIIASVLIIIGFKVYNQRFVDNENSVVTMEYEDEILPNGLYISCSDGNYKTIGIRSCGYLINTNRKKGKVTFYSTIGEDLINSSYTYDTWFIESDNDNTTFECAENKYILEFQNCGKLKISHVINNEKSYTDNSFEGEYIFVCNFDEDCSSIEGL